MPTYMITHRHQPGECRTAFAGWRGFESPLRRRPALSSCIDGAHTVWWQVEAPDEDGALALLPPWVAERSKAVAVCEVEVP